MNESLKRTGIVRNKLVLGTRMPTIEDFLDGNDAMIYGLKGYGSVYATHIASVLEQDGYKAPDCFPPRMVRDDHGVHLYGVTKPFVKGRKVLFVVSEYPAGDTPYLFAKKIRSYEDADAEEERTPIVDSRVLVVDPFELMTMGHVFRDKTLRTLNGETGDVVQSLNDVGEFTSNLLRSASGDILKYMREKPVVIEVGRKSVYTAVGVSLLLHESGVRLEYRHIDRGIEGLGGKDVLLVVDHDDETDATNFKDLTRAREVKTTQEFLQL